MNNVVLDGCVYTDSNERRHTEQQSSTLVRSPGAATMTSQQSIFPVCDPVDTDRSADVLSLADAGEVVEALATENARAILACLHERPDNTSSLAESIGTSIQNAQYHLDHLADVGLVEVVDTWYSARGNEMDVYAPTSEPLLIVAGKSGGDTVVEQVVADLRMYRGPSRHAPGDVAESD